MATLYQSQPYLREGNGTVAAAFEEDGKFYVALQGSIFYPQGGGQKGDRGILRIGETAHVVVDTVKDELSTDGRPLCVLDAAAPDLAQGRQVDMTLDWSHRFKQMRLHSIVHLHHCLLEQVAGHAIPVPTTSDLNTDGTAFNRYDTPLVSEELATQAFEEMRALVQRGAAVRTRDDPEKEGFRYWECLGFTIPCGGTHLKEIAEVGEFAMTFSQKKGKPKVSFLLNQGDLS